MTSSTPRDPNFLSKLIQQVQLAWRLMRDPRVPVWAKALPAAAMVYVISPIDFLPDAMIAMLGLGVVDDIAIFMLGLKGLIDFAPPHVVAEHRAAIMGLPVDDRDWQVDKDIPPSSTGAKNTSKHDPNVIDVD